MAPFTPLVRPRRYFERPDRPSLVVAVAAILAVAAATAATIHWSSRQLLRPLLNSIFIELHTQGPVIAFLEAVNADVVLTAVAVVVGWVVFAALVSLVERLADGEGGFSRSLALTGEAHLSVLALFPLRVAGLWLLIQSSVDPTELVAPIGAPLVYWGTVPFAVVSVLGILWKGAIVGFGLAELDGARGVAVGVTLAAVTSPVLLVLVLEIV